MPDLKKTEKNCKIIHLLWDKNFALILCLSIGWHFQK